jgi:hypothetical protein
MPISPKYDFRVSPSRYPDLFKWLESLPKGDKSFWIIEVLQNGLGIVKEPSAKG